MVSITYQNVKHPKPYRYATLPRTLHYRSYRNLDEQTKPFYGNIMYDKRVVRGNTWALRKMAQEALQMELAEERKLQKDRLKAVRDDIMSKLGPFINIQESWVINHVTTENGKNTTVVLAAGTTDNGKVKTSAKHDQTDLKSSRSVSEKEEKKLADENLAVMANEEKLDSQMTEEISEKSLPKREKSDMSIEAKVETDEIGVGSEPKPEPAESECQTDPKVEELFEEMEDQQPSSEVPHLDLISPRTDAETQIDIEEMATYRDEEWQPFIEVLISQTIEAAGQEVSNELELEELREKQAELESLTAYEKERIEELQQSFKAATIEKEKIAETQARLLETERKLHSRQAALDIVSELVPNAIDQLTTHGYLSDSQQLTSRTFRDEETNTQERLEDYTKNNGEITEEMNFEAGKAESTNEQEENPFDKTQDIIKEVMSDFLPFISVKAFSHVQRDTLSRLLSDSIICELTSIHKKKLKDVIMKIFQEYEGQS